MSTADALQPPHSLAHTVLRGGAGDPAFAAGVRAALGLDLPESVGASASAGLRTILRLGPDEWRVVGPDGAGAQTAAALATALGATRHAVVDVSDQFVTYRLAGDAARDLLASGCPLDLEAMTAGRCAESLLGRAPILLHVVDDQPSFDLHVRRSLADYVGLWLAEAARGA